MAYTVLLVFYSRFFRKTLIRDKKARSLTIKTHRGPLEIRLRFQDFSIFYEIFLARIYALPGHLRHSGAVVDVGAHVGLASLFFWNQYDPDATFYCIEPSPENSELLEYNTRLLNRIIVNKGISDYEGFTTLDTSGLSCNYHLRSGSNSHLSIEVTTMNALFASCRISRAGLVKIDIEGEEERVFNGDLSWLEKTDLLAMELHGDNEYSSRFGQYGFGRLLTTDDGQVVFFQKIESV